MGNFSSKFSFVKEEVDCNSIPDRSKEFVENNFDKIKNECFGDKPKDFLISISKKHNDEYVNCFTNNSPYYCQILLGLKHQKDDLSVNRSKKVLVTSKVESISVTKTKEDNEESVSSIKLSCGEVQKWNPEKIESNYELIKSSCIENDRNVCLKQGKELWQHVQKRKTYRGINTFSAECISGNFQLKGKIKVIYLREKKKCKEPLYRSIKKECESLVDWYFNPSHEPEVNSLLLNHKMIYDKNINEISLIDGIELNKISKEKISISKNEIVYRGNSIKMYNKVLSAGVFDDEGEHYVRGIVYFTLNNKLISGEIAYSSNSISVYGIKDYLVLGVGHTRDIATNYVLNPKAQRLDELAASTPLEAVKTNSKSIVLESYQYSGCCESNLVRCNYSSEDFYCNEGPFEKTSSGVRFFDDLSDECLSYAEDIISSDKNAITLKEFKSNCLYKDFDFNEVRSAFTDEEMKYCEEQFGEIGCEIAIGSYLFPQLKDINSSQLIESNQIESILAKHDLLVIETKNVDINSDGILDKLFLVKGKDLGKIVVDKNYSNGRRDLNRRGIVVFVSYKKFFRLVVYKPFLFHSTDSNGGVYSPPEIDVSSKRDGLYFDYMHGRYGGWVYGFQYDDSSFYLTYYKSGSRTQLLDEFDGFMEVTCDLNEKIISRSFDCMGQEDSDKDRACEKEAAKLKKSMVWDIKSKNKKFQINLNQIDVIESSSILKEAELFCMKVF